MAVVIKKKRNIGWIITSFVGIAFALVFGTLYIFGRVQTMHYSNNLELVYERSFYELTDNINSLDMKLAKILASSSASYQNKMLKEAASNASFAEQNMSILPLETSELTEIHKFFNQVGAYTEYIANENTATGITGEQRTSLNNIREIVGDIKDSMNQISIELQKGFSIIDNLKKLDDDTSAFSNVMSEIKSSDIEFPTMIFDGPFSESQLQKEAVVLQGSTVTQEEAELAVVVLLALEQPFTITFLGKTEASFVTYDFKVEKNNQVKFLSLTEIGGKLLTMSAETSGQEENFTLQDAKRIGLEFVTKVGMENPQVVWDDEINGDIYLNICPVISDVIIYPDLVKVKVDMQSGQVIGFEGTSYYKNHKDRTLESASFDATEARTSIADLGFTIQTTKLCLAPIEYRDEVLCYEFAAEKDGEYYYFFINAKTGDEETILKVVQANDGTLLS